MLKTQEFVDASNLLVEFTEKIRYGFLALDPNGKILNFNSFFNFHLKLFPAPKQQDFFWNLYPDNLFGFSIRSALETQTLPALPINTSPPKHNQLRVNAFLSNSTLIIFFRPFKAKDESFFELGKAASTLIHDIRNPLGGIKGFASLLIAELKDNPLHRSMAERILQAVNNLEHQFSRILSFSRPLSLSVQYTSLLQLIHQIKSYLDADPNISKAIQVNVIGEDIEAAVDPSLIQSALQNLVRNSIDAMPNGGTLTIALSQNEEEIFLSVEDTGEGIAPDQVNHIFDLFFTTRPQGFGFGLAEVKHIVHAHNGQIFVDSHLGEGTKMTIKIPKTLKVKHGD